MKLNSTQKAVLAFGGALIASGLVLSTVIFPFWNLIRADIFEQVKIISNDNGICYAETVDSIPKKIEKCTLLPGDLVTIKYPEGFPWATIAEP